MNKVLHWLSLHLK